MTVEQVKGIQDRIDVKKAELTKAEGRKEQLMLQLKSEFNCSTIEDAEKLQSELLVSIESKKTELVTMSTEIERMLSEGIV